MVRPEGFEPPAYGFEDQEPGNLKRQQKQHYDITGTFRLTFGFVRNLTNQFDLDGHNLGTEILHEARRIFNPSASAEIQIGKMLAFRLLYFRRHIWSMKHETGEGRGGQAKI
jgi:hypothetical protein